MASITQEAMLEWKDLIESLHDIHIQAIESNTESGGEAHGNVMTRIKEVIEDALPSAEHSRKLQRGQEAERTDYIEPGTDEMNARTNDDVNNGGHTATTSPRSLYAVTARTSQEPEPTLRVESHAVVGVHVEALGAVQLNTTATLMFDNIADDENSTENDPKELVKFRFCVPADDCSCSVRTKASASVMIRFDKSSRVYVRKDAKFSEFELEGLISFAGGDAGGTTLVAKSDTILHCTIEGAAIVEVITGRGFVEEG
ncbi:hypothetical protein B0T20DRAFT_397831 [Sordaria brevicollis]|uniref:Uncharacterized protein n=1 Tax=Sordaria brevicollis TaxID=83679 RepID=A0AAE0NV49_SORBR|nr:hypothetical protein B0T20DRAFT_397831 [Sordaria brevicollis]